MPPTRLLSNIFYLIPSSVPVENSIGIVDFPVAILPSEGSIKYEMLFKQRQAPCNRGRGCMPVAGDY
jgi:hypothetical protein